MALPKGPASRGKVKAGRNTPKTEQRIGKASKYKKPTSRMIKAGKNEYIRVRQAKKVTSRGKPGPM